MVIPEEQHNVEIHENLKSWDAKPVLQKIYHAFYQRIVSYITKDVSGKIVELGSGIGNLKMLVPDVICTDLFKNPWIDQVESAYKMSFADKSISNIILFDVWHHLEYPGDALAEIHRVLNDKGRVIIFDPYISLFGRLVYGPFHHEPIGWREQITWKAPAGVDIMKTTYYAAQGNATRIFRSSRYKENLAGWEIVQVKRISAISYVLSGGYSKKQMYPDKMLPLLNMIDVVLNLMPRLFAVRLLTVLEKK